MSHFMKRLITALVGVIVAIAWAGAATAGAQTQVDDDFSGGTHDGTELVAPDDLALRQVIDIVEDFDGTALPSGWVTVPWETGGSATVADDLLTVNGARANTTSLYDSNRLLDFAATFTADGSSTSASAPTSTTARGPCSAPAAGRSLWACTRGHWRLAVRR